MEYDYLFKFLMLGDSGVGKSCLLINFIDKRFRPDHQINIGVEFGSINVHVGQKVIKLQIWDTAGQEIFRSIIKSYYKNAAAAILVFDVTDESSFNNLESWLGEIRQHANQKITIIICGNKIDLEDKRKISTAQGEEFAASHGLKYMETSAKLSINVEDVFMYLANTICQRLDKELGTQEEDVDMDDVVLLDADKMSRYDNSVTSRRFCCNQRYQSKMERSFSEGEIYTWGSGEMGQLGYPASEIMALPKDQEGYPYQPSPSKVHYFKGFQIDQVAGGDGHSLAVTTTGKVYAWGASAWGQLGLQDIREMPTDAEGYPYQPEPKIIDSLSDYFIIQVACGDAHTIALTNQGLVFSWGGGGCGQLGHRDTIAMPKDEDGCPYQPVPRLVEDITCKVKHISCGKAHTVAVAEEGQIFTWGAGACGQLGHPDTSSFPFDEDGYPFHPTPRAVTSLRTARIVMSACGDVHTLALTDEGAVYCFGGGSFGQLGLGHIKNLPVDVDECPFMPVPKQIETLKNIRVVQLSCGDSHSMALSENGELYGWGAAAWGQLGLEDLQHLPKDSENSPYEPDPQLIKSLRGKLVKSVSCGEAHTLALTDKGCVYSFGASNCGQLGLKFSESADTQTQRRSQAENKLVSYQAVPKLVTGLLNKHVVSVASGGVHNVVICEAP